METYAALPLLRPPELPRSLEQIRKTASTDALRGLMIASGAAALAEHDASLQLALAVAQLANPSHKVGLPTIEAVIHHDSYCQIERVSDEPVRGFIRGFLQANCELHEEVVAGGTSLSPLDWGTLRGAFEDMIAYMIGTDEMCPAGGLAEMVSTSYWNPDPVRRWILGHHVFMGLIQGLIVCSLSLRTAVLSEDWAASLAALEIATSLMAGSAMALKFTADFRPEYYESIVRPTMMPPQSPPGLSGLLSQDHAFMVKTLGSLQPLLQNLPPNLMLQYEHFSQTFELAYDAHMFVCERFRGGERPSLLVTTRVTGGTDETAVDVLKRLKTERVKRVRVWPAKVDATAKIYLPS